MKKEPYNLETLPLYMVHCCKEHWANEEYAFKDKDTK